MYRRELFGILYADAIICAIFTVPIFASGLIGGGFLW